MKHALLLVALVASLGAALASVLRSPERPLPPIPSNAPAKPRPGADATLSALTPSVGTARVQAGGVPDGVEGVGGPAAPADGPKTEGKISGVVVDGDREPMAGATCRIFHGTPPSGWTGLVSRPRPTAELFAQGASDAGGAFAFEVPPGFWTLRIEAPDRAPWEESHLAPGDTRWVQMRAARPRTVRVVDPAGRPVAGAEVRLLRGRYGDPETAVEVLRADASGQARIESVPAGSWCVQAAHPDYVTRRLPLEAPSAAPFEIELTRGLRIEGRVSTVGGRSLDRAKVHFETTGGLITSHSVDVQPDGTYTSASAFPPGGSLEVAVVAPGFGESRRVVRLGPPAGSASGGPEAGGAASTEGVRGSAPLGGNPPGAAWVQREDFLLESSDRSVSGRIVDSDGEPVARVEVWLRPLVSLPPETVVPIPGGEEILAGGLPDLSAYDPKASAVARLRFGARTDADGVFLVDGLHPLRAYSLLVLSPVHSNAAIWVEEGRPGQTTDLGTTVLEAPGRLWGHVRRADGRPLEGVLVYSVGWKTNEVVPDSEYHTARPRVRAAGLEAITNDEGYFAIQPFPASEFRLYYGGSLTDPMVLAEGQELGGLELVVPDPRTKVPVHLTVLDTLGVPVPQAYASLTWVPPGHPEGEALPYDYETFEAAAGEPDGSVRVTARPGRYQVEVKDLQGWLSERVFRVDIDEEGLEREVQLLADPVPPGPLEGHVRTALGEGIPGIEVSWIPTTGATSCGCLKTRVVTDERGAFSFGPVMRGAHRLVARDPRDRFAPASHYPARPGPPLEILMQ